MTPESLNRGNELLYEIQQAKLELSQWTDGKGFRAIVKEALGVHLEATTYVVVNNMISYIKKLEDDLAKL